MLRALAALLLVWEPLRFASEALGVLPTLAYRGAAAALELLAHGVIAALCAAAGLALWNGSPDGRRLSRAAVVLSAARVLQSLYWSALPDSTVPGDEPWIAIAAVIAAGAALLVLRFADSGSAPRRT